MELTACIHMEEGTYWAELPELPGCFDCGGTRGDELSRPCRLAPEFDDRQ